MRRRAALLATKLADAREDAFDAVLRAGKVSKAARKTGTSNKTTDAPLTAAEIAALRAAIADYDVDAFVDSLYDDSSDLVHVAYQDAAETLELNTGADGGFDTPPVWAIDHVKDAADRVGSLVEERDKAALTQVLDDAITGGLTAADTAKMLRAALETVRSVDDDGNVRQTPADSWYTMVARTELQAAAVQGQLSLYEAAGVQKLQWQAAEPCDECAEYDGKIYAMDDLPDDEPGSIHPNCRCVWVAVDDDLGDWSGTAEDRAAARRGNAPAADDDDEE